MKNYSELLKNIEQLKNEERSGIRGAKSSLLKVLLQNIENSIKYEKLKIERHKLGDLDFKIDICENDDLLFLFFGSNDIIENEKKIKDLKKLLREVNKKDRKPEEKTSK